MADDHATSEQKQSYIQALLRERAGYEQYGQTERVAEVDAELDRIGGDAKPPHKRATRVTRKHADESHKARDGADD